MKFICDFCFNKEFKTSFVYKNRPNGETDFKISKKKYFRYYKYCTNCKHHYSILYFNLKDLYKTKYSKHTYGKEIDKIFKKIVNLPQKKSDNYLRVKRFLNFFEKKNIYKKNILDIGSGIGIFPYSLKQLGLNITCLESDKNLSNYLSKDLKLKTIKKDFINANIKNKFDIITLNKVLEHLEAPIPFLKKIYKILKKNGVLYLEVPDTLSATKKGKNREEFFVEHLHGFTKNSLRFLCRKTQYKIVTIKSIIEPSTKYTIYSFIKKQIL